MIFIGGLRYRDSITGMVRSHRGRQLDSMTNKNQRETRITAPMRGKEDLEEEFEIVRDDKTVTVVCEDWGST